MAEPTRTPARGAGGWLNARWHGVPHWALVGVGGAVVLGVYVLRKRRASSQAGTSGGQRLPSDLSGYGYGASPGGAAGGVGGGIFPNGPAITPGAPATPNTPTQQGMPVGGLQSGALSAWAAGWQSGGQAQADQAWAAALPSEWRGTPPPEMQTSDPGTALARIIGQVGPPTGVESAPTIIFPGMTAQQIATQRGTQQNPLTGAVPWG